MATVWTLLTIFIIASSSHVQADDHEVSWSCLSDTMMCSQNTITRGRCVSTWNSFMLNNLRNDVNNDCQAAGVDFAVDIADDYDTNKDGLLCGDEWITRRTEYGGLSQEFVSFEWNNMFSPDGSCLSAEMFENAPAQDLTTTFTNNNIMRLVIFCNSSMNMMYNRDCWGLTYICKEARAEFEACQMFDRSYMSLSEKIMAKRKAVDANMDSTVTPTELRDFLSDKFDANGDGCIDQMEYMNVATNEYQFSQEFAGVEFKSMLDGSGSCINLNNLKIGSEGLSVPDMVSGILERLVQMCEMTENAYETNKDCAMVVDTCLSSFPKKEACAIYVDNCGLQRYSSCINKLTRSSCMSEAGSYAVFMETLRIDNQLKFYCTPHDGGAYWSAAQTTKVGYASLVFSLFLATLYMYI